MKTSVDRNDLVLEPVLEPDHSVSDVVHPDHSVSDVVQPGHQGSDRLFEAVHPLLDAAESVEDAAPPVLQMATAVPEADGQYRIEVQSLE
jgi:hypothetical protein